MAGTDFGLGDWIIRPQRCSIEHGDESVRVKPKSMAVLERLAEAAGDVVSRNDLFDTVWPGGVVSDDVLTHCVVELRKAFGDSARDARIIETIPKKGFRLIPDVTSLANESATATSTSVEASAVSEKEKWQPAIRTLFIVVFAILMVVTLFWYRTVSRDPQPSDLLDGTKTIAVLPFVDMSPDGDQDYFADGLSEELINRLTRLDGLQVTGRTSSFYFKGKNEQLRVIGEALNVAHVVEGSVRRSENQLRITAQLLDVTTGFQIWADDYDRTLDNVFAVQEQIAEEVARALSVKLSVGELGSVVGGTTNIAAYDEVMLGDSLAPEMTADSVLDAIEHYRRAAEIDPGYALAWAKLASQYRIANVAIIGNEESHNWQELSEEALARAISLAPTARIVLNETAFQQMDRWQWSDAERTLSQGAGLADSTDMWAIGTYADFLAKVGRTGEAIVLMERARRLDPLSAIPAHYLGHLYAMQGRIDDALSELERGYALGGQLPQLSVEGIVSALSADDSDVLQHWLARAIEHQQPEAHGAHEAMGRLLDDREAALNWLRSSHESSPSTDYYVVIWASHYGDTELALNAMRRSPEPWSFWIPLTSEVRQLPRFKELVVDMGLVDYWREFGWGDFCHPVGTDDFECE